MSEDTDLGTTGADTETTVDATASDDRTTSGPDTSSETESFFDPKTVPEELKPAYKQMQAAFTKRMQEAAKYRDKIAVVEQFESDPQGTIRQLAQQYGVSLAQAKEMAEEGEWNPKDWSEVLTKAEERAEQRVLKRLEPVIGKVRDLQKSQMETYFDSNYSDWRQYEDDMIKLLQTHPTLANDPDRLYEMSIPTKVREARAIKAAMEKLKVDSQGAKVSGPSATGKTAAAKPSGPMTLDQAAEFAREKLAKGGMRPS